MNEKKLMNRAADNIRILAASMVEKANSGHPGGAMGGADFVNVLFSEFLVYDPENPRWEGRDRFFLDPGHMSPMLYSTLALTGKFTMEELAQFRHWGSPTPGHPEVDIMRGIENTSGPLGQGHTFAVGAAIAAKFLKARLGHVMDQTIYAYISDGGIQEEISQGAGRLAGHLGLDNLIMFYDSNDIQLSTATDAVTSEDVAKKYEAWHWKVITIDGNAPDAIRTALTEAKAVTGQPTLIIGKTIMGKAARKADVAILCMGDNEETSGENFDRTDLNLPGRQLELVQAVYATGTPVVLVLQTGRPVSAKRENDHLPAILGAWFPGEQGGTAIAKTLFGDAAPGGRLPITFPRSVGQIPCHYSRRPGGGKRYVEMDWLPLYPFGYGLTYTTFAYRDMALSRSVIDPQDTVTVSVTVTNTGKYTGDAVTLLYVRDLFSSVVKPERQLAAFRRLTLAPGESRRVELTVGPKQLRTLGPEYVWRLEPGKFELQLGDNAENILLRADLTVE